MGTDSTALDLAYPLIARWEGIHKKGPDGRYHPYLCPALVWTIGVGSTRWFDGTRVTKDTPSIDIIQARALCRLEMEGCQDSALVLSPNLSLYPTRLAAIISFIYNLGAGNYKSSTLRRKINAGDFQAASEEIKKWKWAGGRILPGLVARREEESKWLLQT